MRDDKAVDIVGVHGIFQHRSSRAAMKATWTEAVLTGMENRASNRTSVNLECAFYGDLYNTGIDGPLKGLDVGPSRLSQLASPLEMELLMNLAADPDTAENLPSKSFGLVTLQSALRRLQANKLFGGAEDQIIRWIRQVSRYLSDSQFHDLVQAEMSRAIQSAPRVIIAHSLGSVVAYEWLVRHGAGASTTLITLGSPLGLKAIRRRLGDEGKALVWPTGIDTWVNVANENDVVATVKVLADIVDGDVDDRISRGPLLRSHSAVEYLTNTHTASSLVRVFD